MDGKELFFDDVQPLFVAEYYVDETKDTHISAFVKGYVRAKKDIQSYIRAYLWEHYKINPELNSWVEQVDHYAFDMGLNWERGFFHLLGSIIDSPLDVSSEIAKVGQISHIEKAGIIDRDTKSIQLPSGRVVTVGDYIRLNDKVGDSYKQTKFFDASLRNPSWELIYASDKDFNFANFYFIDDYDNIFVFDKVRALLDNTISKIEYISVQDGVTFVYTNLFRIDVENALTFNEITLLDIAYDSITPTDFTMLLYRDLSEWAVLNELVNQWCFQDLRFLNKTWHRCDRHHTGSWYKKK